MFTGGSGAVGQEGDELDGGLVRNLIGLEIFEGVLSMCSQGIAFDFVGHVADEAQSFGGLFVPRGSREGDSFFSCVSTTSARSSTGIGIAPTSTSTATCSISRFPQVDINVHRCPKQSHMKGGTERPSRLPSLDTRHEFVCVKVPIGRCSTDN